jgi:hypothetical protein
LADIRKESLEWIGLRVIMDHEMALRKCFRISRWGEEEWENLD